MVINKLVYYYYYYYYYHYLGGQLVSEDRQTDRQK